MQPKNSANFIPCYSLLVTGYNRIHAARSGNTMNSSGLSRYVLDRYVLELIEDLGHLHPLGALLLALIAGHAVPQHIRAEGQVLDAQATAYMIWCGNMPKASFGFS